MGQRFCNQFCETTRSQIPDDPAHTSSVAETTVCENGGGGLAGRVPEPDLSLMARRQGSRAVAGQIGLPA